MKTVQMTKKPTIHIIFYITHHQHIFNITICYRIPVLPISTYQYVITYDIQNGK